MAGYAYVPDSDLLEKVTSGGLVTEYGYETHRNLKTQVRNTWAPPPANETVLSQYDYRYDELGRRKSVGNSGTAFINGEKSVFHNIHTYNDRNELTGSERKAGTVAAPAAVVDAEGRLYEYDPIGNRINSTEGTGPQVTYARNGVNQYTALTGGVSASPAYDDDGNMTGYDGATYTWNAENRLIAAETADKRITFLYDYMGRRVRKKVYSGTPGSWNASPDETRVFVYDGWNLIRETVTAGASDSDTYYVWGLDLSQSVQGAGGIGGLLCGVSGGEVRQYTYDANGNVGQLVNEDGGIVARYEYDPFGNEIVADGDAAAGNPFRFSMKYLDAETGLVYYGFRYYHTELGRWISRDPMGEQGGANIYCYIFNDTINLFDLLGLSDCKRFLQNPAELEAYRTQYSEANRKWSAEYKREKMHDREYKLLMKQLKFAVMKYGSGSILAKEYAIRIKYHSKMRNIAYSNQIGIDNQLKNLSSKISSYELLEFGSKVRYYSCLADEYKKKWQQTKNYNSCMPNLVVFVGYGADGQVADIGNASFSFGTVVYSPDSGWLNQSFVTYGAETGEPDGIYTTTGLSLGAGPIFGFFVGGENEFKGKAVNLVGDFMLFEITYTENDAGNWGITVGTSGKGRGFGAYMNTSNTLLLFKRK